MTNKSILEAIVLFAVSLLATWGDATLEAKPVRWVEGLILASVLALAALLGSYWRGKKAH